MSDIRTIGISTGGGDCPGLNAVIRAATKCAHRKYGWRVMGITDGFDGLIYPERSFELTTGHISGILPRGGTILGTTNRGNPFKWKTTDAAGNEVITDISAQVVENARILGIDAVIVIGGDGTQAIGLELFHKGLKTVGVPKTIDNDLSATEVTFGFDSALHTCVDAIDRLFTTAESHHRVMVCEVMGRDAGWIALEAGIAGGAHVILLPEIPFDIHNVCDYIRKREAARKKFTVVVVAEGVKAEGVKQQFEKEKRAQPRAGTVGNLIGDAIAMGVKKDVRVTVLGHTQRGGSPSPFDRILSTRFGVAAVELIAQGQFGKMVALRGGQIVAVDIAEACGKMKRVEPESELVRMAKSIGVCFGD